MTKESTDGETCLVPGCNHKPYSRGQCQDCYATFRKQRKSDPKLEPKLIRKGWLLPAQTNGRKPKSALGKELAKSRKAGAK